MRRLAKILLTAIAVFLLAIAAFLLWLVTCEEKPTFDTAAAAGVSFTPLQMIVPGKGLPKDLETMRSNNNLDVVSFKDRVFFAFRTAPTHFASKKTRIVVLSSRDRKQWTEETALSLNSDLREPRFLVFKDKLFLYFFKAGTNPLSFAPESIYALERKPDSASWTKPRPIFKPGYVVWRAKTFKDKAYMSVYLGAGLYTTADRPGDLRLLTSNDGYDWKPISDKPQVSDVSAEEGEFAFDDDGNLVATVRLETHGALVCAAPHDDLAHWRTNYTPYKYDSAIMFRQGKDFYVIARRNVAGPFDAPGIMPQSIHRAWRLVRYSLTRKRTALYKVNTENLTLAPLFDFPSKGDTAYAGLIPLDDKSYYVLNYSSAPEGLDWPWLGGQIAGSQIYETVLSFK